MKKLLLIPFILFTLSANAFLVIGQGWCSWNGGKGVFLMVNFPYNTEVQVRTYPALSFVEEFTTPTLASGQPPNHFIQANQSSMNNPVSIQFRYRTVGSSTWSQWGADSDNPANCWETNRIGIASICLGLAVNENTMTAKRTGEYIDITLVVTEGTKEVSLEISGVLVPVMLPSSGKFMVRIRNNKVVNVTKL